MRSLAIGIIIILTLAVIACGKGDASPTLESIRADSTEALSEARTASDCIKPLKPYMDALEEAKLAFEANEGKKEEFRRTDEWKILNAGLKLAESNMREKRRSDEAGIIIEGERAKYLKNALAEIEASERKRLKESTDDEVYDWIRYESGSKSAEREEKWLSDDASAKAELRELYENQDLRPYLLRAAKYIWKQTREYKYEAVDAWLENTREAYELEAARARMLEAEGEYGIKPYASLALAEDEAAHALNEARARIGDAMLACMDGLTKPENMDECEARKQAYMTITIDDFVWTPEAFASPENHEEARKLKLTRQEAEFKAEAEAEADFLDERWRRLSELEAGRLECIASLTP